MRVCSSDITEPNFPANIGGSFTSRAMNVDSYQVYSIQADFTGSPVGEAWLEASCNKNFWVEIEDTRISVASTASRMWNLPMSGYEWVQIRWEPGLGSSGTMALDLDGRTP